MVEHLLVGHTDGIADISAPIDNLIIQLLIDVSCQTKPSSSAHTLDEFNQQIRCHKYCQARLNLVLDALLNESDHYNSVATKMLHQTPSSTSPSLPIADLDRYKLLYTAELLFTVRLNRLLMQAFEMAESLVEGLKEFSAAQGICAVKLMRMHRCAMCSGEVLIRPCPELCFTILSSCFQPLSELQGTWKLFTGSIESVVSTFLTKPQLSLVAQMKQLPERLIAYFRYLLEAHLKWLQPQCAGTSRLLSLMQSSSSTTLFTEHETDPEEVTTMQSYRNLMTQIQFKMDQMAELWLRVSSAICTESAYLVPITNDLDQCWNGTDRGRFFPEHCDFCDTKNSLFPSANTKRVQNDFDELDNMSRSELSTSARQQRTSNWFKGEPENQEHIKEADSEKQWNSLLSMIPNKQERIAATNRANEILVRASGDLQWSTDMLLGEIRAYRSVYDSIKHPQTGERPKDGSLIDGPTETWVQIPSNQITVDASINHDYSIAQSNNDGLDNSLRTLAYTTMLGWNVQDLERMRHSVRVRPSESENSLLREHSQTNKNPNGHRIPNMTQYGQPVHNKNSSQFSHVGVEGSGHPIDWSGYGWPQPLVQIPEEHNTDPNLREQLIEDQDIKDQSYEGSGYLGTNEPVPTFMQYADYPSLSTFHNIVNTVNLGGSTGESSRPAVYGVPTDDEDFERPTDMEGNSNMSDLKTRDNAKSNANGTRRGEQEGSKVVAKIGTNSASYFQTSVHKRRQILLFSCIGLIIDNTLVNVFT